jgi:small subunit ribosomal protein S2
MKDNTPTQPAEPEAEEQKPVEEITIQSLLSSGAHYGHVTEAWSPKMAPYLCGSKSVVDTKRRDNNKKDIYIFDLELTLKLWRRARKVIVENARKGGTILFIGVKPQCKEIIKREADRSGSFYVCNKWVGGLLTNFQTLNASVKRIELLEKQLTNKELSTHYTKKELLLKQRELDTLLKKFGGVRSMTQPPDMLFIVDVSKNHIAVAEATALGIPVVGITDSNADPDSITHIIPANDDAAGAINLIVSNVADAVIEGKQMLQEDVITDNEGADTCLETETTD